MPELDQAKLTFGAVLSLFRGPACGQNQSVHEQFVTACLLHAKSTNQRPRHRTERVETKRITASDDSSNTRLETFRSKAALESSTHSSDGQLLKEKIDSRNRQSVLKICLELHHRRRENAAKCSPIFAERNETSRHRS